MAMTGAGAFTLYETALAGLGITFNDAQSEAVMTALFQAMIDEMKANMEVEETQRAAHLHTHLASIGNVR